MYAIRVDAHKKKFFLVVRPITVSSLKEHVKSRTSNSDPPPWGKCPEMDNCPIFESTSSLRAEGCKDTILTFWFMTCLFKQFFHDQMLSPFVLEKWQYSLNEKYYQNMKTKYVLSSTQHLLS